MGYIGVNCRPVTPSSSGQYTDYHGRTPGFSLYPLNISAFRFALEVIVSGLKDAWISSLWSNERLDHLVLPGNVLWYNPNVPYYPSDWTIAESILIGAGFGWDYGPDSVPHTPDDKWTCPDGTVLWDGTRPGPWKSDRYAGYITAPGEDAYGFWVIAPSQMLNPVFYELTMRHAKKWNLFFCGVEDVKPATMTGPNYLFIDDSKDIFPPPGWPNDVIYGNRDHDFYNDGTIPLDRHPDYLYDFFHPDVDIPYKLNTAGLDNPGLNRLLKTIKFWKFYDWELLTSNFDGGIGLVPPCTTFGPYGPFISQVPISVVVERVDPVGGVYEEELVEGVHYTKTWIIVAGLRYVAIHIETFITLYPGDALELKFPTDTYDRVIIDIEEMQEIVYLTQWKLYNLIPYLPILFKNRVNLYKVKMDQNEWLEGWVESPGFGSQPIEHTIPWTFNNLHWNTHLINDIIRYPLVGVVSTLNPIAAYWVYERTVLWRLYDSLFVINPYTHENMPWVSYRWEIESWTDYLLNVENGVKFTFYLRSDVTWQDGTPVTAQDIAWNFDFIESITPPELDFIWKPLIKWEILNEYKIKLYVNATQWSFYDFGSWALIFPQIAWQTYIGDYDPATTEDYEAAVAYKPWEVPHPLVPGLTMLYGTGPYIFDYWDPLIGKGEIHLEKNYNYWARLNINDAQATLGIDGLLYHITKEQGSVYYTVQFINVNPTQIISFTYWGAFKDVGSTGPRPGASIILYPYQSVTFTYGPTMPSPTGDLGGGTPPRFFDYDNVVDGKDLSLLLRVMKSGITGEYIPQWWTIYINGVLWKQS